MTGRASFILLLLLVSAAAVVAEESPLPDPLSLQQAMAMANDSGYYQLIEAQAAVIDAQSQLDDAESALGFRAQLEIEAAYIDPAPVKFDQERNDSHASLRFSQPLYDFGRSHGKILAASLQQSALQEYIQYIISQRQIDIARQFFEVILADLKFAWDNEAMSMAYVDFDADKDRHALAEISDVSLMQSEDEYLDTLHQRNLSEVEQRNSRALLAELLNRPAQLPENLQLPTLDFSRFPLPEYPAYLKTVMQNNLQIRLAEKQFEAARQRFLAEQKQFAPRLEAQLLVSEYARKVGSNDDLRAQLNLVMPIYEDRGMKKNIARARAEKLKQQAQLMSTKMQIRQQALQLWQQARVLGKRRRQLQASQAFRELNLDRSRALYEMEVKTDLGDSMVAISEIQYKQAKNDFELILALMQMKLLAGEAPSEYFFQTGVK